MSTTYFPTDVVVILLGDISLVVLHLIGISIGSEVLHDLASQLQQWVVVWDPDIVLIGNKFFPVFNGLCRIGIILMYLYHQFGIIFG